jgi:arginase family enzyme
MTQKIPHFFKAYSRIGLTHPPIRQLEWNHGVEEGSDAILSHDFLKTFSNSKVDEYHFTNPEDIKASDYWDVLSKELAEFKELIIQRLASNETQVVIGGDNCVTFSSLLAVLEKASDPTKVGYLQFDSHGEMCSFKGSDSKNFHGMYLRPFFEHFDIPEIAALVPSQLKSDQALFFGDMVLDGDEPAFFKKQKFINITFNNHQKNMAKNEKLLADFIARYEYIHVNFDVDIFHHSVSKATGIPYDGKWFLKEVLKLLEIISVHPNLSFDLSEVNPKKEGIDQTIKVAQTVLKTVLKS